LINFSRAFLPEKRGGRMDAPIVISTELNPLEIDDEVYDVDVVSEYPLSFYKSAEAEEDLSKINIKTFGDIVQEKDSCLNWGFTHAVSDINQGVLRNIYTEGEMLEKLKKQLNLAEKIRAVDEKNVAEKILQSHFIPDIKGNLRTFSRQKIRCTKCNAKYRRAPLLGRCTRCNGNLTLTVHEGTIKKYLEVSKDLVKKYHIDPYFGQQIELFDRSINSIFGEEEQKTLDKFK
jgi:DNA polymerase II large subunit